MGFKGYLGEFVLQAFDLFDIGITDFPLLHTNVCRGLKVKTCYLTDREVMLDLQKRPCSFNDRKEKTEVIYLPF